MYRNTYVEIDENIVGDNIKKIVSNTKYKYYIGVVKNNAYGHGINIINTMIKNGINYLAVSSLDEAMEIRKINKEIPVLILEPVSLNFIKVLEDNNITITIDSYEYAKELLKENIKSKLKVHIKIDSGLNRLGIKTKEELRKTYELLTSSKNILLEGIYTHFATSGYYDIHYKKQITNFENITSCIDLKNIPIVHLDRSITFAIHNKIEYANGVRLGVCMYGIEGKRTIPSGIKGKIYNLKRSLFLKKYKIDDLVDNNLGLKESFSLYSEVVSSRTCKPGETIGYGATYKVEEECYLSTISVGYADGVTEKYKYVYINDKRYEIVAGYMDMITIKSTEKINVGEIVEVIGKNNTIKELSRRLNTNAYHLFNMITTRVPRKYKEENKIIKY